MTAPSSAGQLVRGYLDSPVGTLAVVVDGDGRLVSIDFLDPDRPLSPAHPEAGQRIAAVATQLREYFAGERREFDLELAPRGTEFQLQVWEALREIPWGETRSYGELASAIGRPAASRAVGAANGANPIPIVVPCHRVIGSNGSLTGYGGGLERKQTLLEIEGIEVGRRTSGTLPFAEAATA
jgi:methylated-DNA-[protein]-cysteine S-methyltransferase